MDSNSVLSAMVAVIVIILVFMGVTSLWYNDSSSWHSFSATSATYDWPQWSSTSINGASALRFRNCIFTVALASSPPVQQTHDVTAVLNEMALQQKSPVIPTTTTISTGSGKFQPSMSLVRPLNPFSFAIPGFNDPTTLAGTDISLYPWCIANCVTPNTAGGYTNAPPAVVTLTGEYRTI